MMHKYCKILLCDEIEPYIVKYRSCVHQAQLCCLKRNLYDYEGLSSQVTTTVASVIILAFVLTQETLVRSRQGKYTKFNFNLISCILHPFQIL